MYSSLYLAAIVLVNYAFSILPLVPLPWGGVWPLASLLVGGIFVVRDYAQQEIGHKVLYVMAIGAVLSFLLANPYVAIASLCAFAVSELVDWAIFSYTKKPLGERIVISSLIATPIDSAVFLYMIDQASIASILIMTASKMVWSLFLWKKK